MNRMIFVLPVCRAGTPGKVDEFFRREDLQGAGFDVIGEAEIFLLGIHQKYESSPLFDHFAIFENTAHATRTECGYKIAPTAERHVI